VLFESIAAGDLVALFNGYRIAKSTNKRAIKYGDEEWSDFRCIF
jgi:hypothetical protein